VYGHGFVTTDLVALAFTGMRADTPRHAGERIARMEPQQGFVGFSFRYEGVYLLDGVAQKAQLFAGRGTGWRELP